MNMTSKTKQGKTADVALQWMIKHPRKTGKMTYEQIAQKFGVAASTVMRRVWDATDEGVDVPLTIGRGCRVRHDVASLLRSNKDARKWTREQIAEHLGCTTSTVTRKIIELKESGSKLVRKFFFYSVCRTRVKG